MKIKKPEVHFIIKNIFDKMDLGLFLFSCNDLQMNDLRQNQPSTVYKGILKAICDLSDLTG